jgi:YVTN family beta-propeller protein
MDDGSAGIQIRLLGATEASLGGRAIALGGARQRAVLAMLALHVNERVSVDSLIEGLWGDDQPPTAAKMIQLHVSHLRKLLVGDDVEIVTRGRGYELRMPADAVDAARFERLVTAAAQAERPDSQARRALELWRGPPLGDLADEPFAGEAIRHLEEVHLRARELAIDAALAAGEHGQVVGELEELVARHPLREHLHEQLMLALYRSGRQADALQAYQDARGALVEQIGVEPGPALRRLHERILRQDAALDAPARDATAPPASEAASPAALPPGEPAGLAASMTRVARGRRTLMVVAVVAAACGLVAFAVGRLVGEDSLEGLREDTVGVIDPGDGRITAQYRVGHAPGAIAAGAGSVWIANARDGTVSRVDRGREQVTTIDVGGEPTALAYGAGSLWVADAERRRLAQVDSRTNRVVRRYPTGNAPRGVTVAAGAVWVASPVDGQVDRIDLAGGGAVRRIGVGGGPAALAAGAGAVWVAGEEGGVLVRLDARSGAALKSIGVGNGPAGVSVGEGGVWVANRDDGTVTRVDPATSSVTDTIRVGGRPVGVATGEGAVWVADARGATVARIDPGTGRVTRRVDVGGSPASVAVADGSVWAPALASRESHRGGTLRYQSASFAFCNGCIDPAGYDAANLPVLSAVYDGLLAYRRADGTAGTTLVGNLATDVPQASDGGRTYVLQLRPGLRFSNGAPVRPEDFRASIERFFRITPPPAPPVFDDIVGAEACGPKRCDLSRGIETDARARTITVRLRTPDAEFPHKLALSLAWVVPADSPLELARTRPLPGTGPYRIVESDPNRSARLVRNRRFRSWSAEARPDGFPDEIAVAISDDPIPQIRAVRAGRADVQVATGTFSVDLPVAELRKLVAGAPTRVHSSPVVTTDFVFLNVRERPFDDARVRRALNYAIDRRDVVRRVGGPGMVSVTCQVIPPGLPGYVPTCPYTSGSAAAGGWTAPDLPRARRLVTQSGTRGMRVEVWSFGGLYEQFARAARDALERLGYRARVRVIPDIGRYFGYIGTPSNRVQAGVYGWIGDFLTPSSFFESTFRCPKRGPPSAVSNNASRFCDPAVDAAYARAIAAPGSEDNALWAELDRRVVSAAPTVPLVNRREVVFVSERVGNVQQHPHQGPLLDQFWVR